MRLPLALAVLPCIISLCIVSKSPAGENWHQFRGPRGDGHATAGNPPLTWSETENVQWKTAIHGKAWSSPVVWGQQVWLTTAPADGKELYGVCVDLQSGKILHDIKLADIAEPQFCIDYNSYASSTPTIEEGRVYLHFGAPGTFCLDTATGKTLWSRLDLECDHHRGAASSPVIFENLLLLTFDGFDVQYVLALDKETGKTVWKTDRKIDYGSDNGDVMKAYSTPSIIEVEGQLQMISPSAGATVAYNPRTGEELWRVKSGGMNASAKPLYGHGLIYATTAAGGWQLFAVDPKGRGDISSSNLAWKSTKSIPTRSSPILIGDLMFMVNDMGVAGCIDAKTGESVWQSRLGGKFSASPIYAGGRIYFFSEEGATPVIEPGREFKLLATNQLDAGFMASPAVVGNALILRTKTHLYRIEK